ncbi:MAG: hypothetical protein K8L99_29815 [Anaerolineae bacterium]|nr:hypothetical protein [Anaerolineae bacterium]
MTQSLHEMAIDILRQTNDGDDLAPEHLKLLEMAVNQGLSEEGETAFHALYENVQQGYTRPWFHGIEHLTIDHEGFVYWKGNQVEHYSPSWAYSDEAKVQARELAQRCLLLERTGREVNTTNVIWNWDKGELSR